MPGDPKILLSLISLMEDKWVGRLVITAIRKQAFKLKIKEEGY